MPRRTKPPGFENWTWDEIEMGRKMSRGEKKARNLHKAFGATKRPDGSLKAPTYDESPAYWLILIPLLLVGLVVAIMSGH